MSKGFFKVFLRLAAVFAAAVVVVSLAASYLFDINRYTPQIEGIVSKAVGMEFKIRGGIKLAILPEVEITLKDVRAGNGGREFFSSEEIRVAPELRALVLRRDFLPKRFELVGPRFFIERDASGRFNFENRAKTAVSLPMPPMPETVSVKGGEIAYLDGKSGLKAEIKGLDARLAGLTYGAGGIIAFAGDLRAKSLRAGALEARFLRADIRGEKGVFTLKPLYMDIYGGRAEGSLAVDKINGRLKLKQKITGLDIGATSEALNQKKLVSGRLDVSADISANIPAGGTGAPEIAKSISGRVSMRGANLKLNSVDLDRVLRKYEKSQSFDLKDLGAVLIAGPFGPLLTRGYAFADVLRQFDGGSTPVRMLVSEWAVKNGVAEAKDVAMATPAYRVAFKGKLDFAAALYRDFTVAVVDERGCAKFSQKISGPFKNPKAEGAEARALLGPVKSLLAKAEGLVKSKKAPRCEVFYDGAVRHPR